MFRSFQSYSWQSFQLLCYHIGKLARSPIGTEQWGIPFCTWTPEPLQLNSCETRHPILAPPRCVCIPNTWSTEQWWLPFYTLSSCIHSAQLRICLCHYIRVHSSQIPDWSMDKSHRFNHDGPVFFRFKIYTGASWSECQLDLSTFKLVLENYVFCMLQLSKEPPRHMRGPHITWEVPTSYEKSPRHMRSPHVIWEVPTSHEKFPRHMRSPPVTWEVPTSTLSATYSVSTRITVSSQSSWTSHLLSRKWLTYDSKDFSTGTHLTQIISEVQ